MSEGQIFELFNQVSLEPWAGLEAKAGCTGCAGVVLSARLVEIYCRVYASQVAPRDTDQCVSCRSGLCSPSVSAVMRSRAAAWATRT